MQPSRAPGGERESCFRAHEVVDACGLVPFARVGMLGGWVFWGPGRWGFVRGFVGGYCTSNTGVGMRSGRDDVGVGYSGNKDGRLQPPPG